MKTFDENLEEGINGTVDLMNAAICSIKDAVGGNLSVENYQELIATFMTVAGTLAVVSMSKDMIQASADIMGDIDR